LSQRRAPDAAHQTQRTRRHGCHNDVVAESTPGPDLAAELLDLTWHFDDLDHLGVIFAALLVPDRPWAGIAAATARRCNQAVGRRSPGT
jgi:hypothetical protein